MDRSLLAHLTCPRSGQPLNLFGERVVGESVVSGELSGGGRRFPIFEGIPIFVDAETLDDQTLRSFDRKWAQHRYYREHTSRFYTQWYLERYGFYSEDGLREALREAQFILDAGTGAGRDAANLARFSEARVFAIDMSREALDTASKALSSPRLGFVHADLHELPFPDGFFDVINCDQVIHHTPNPRAAFEALSRKLRIGGQVCCYVYRKKAPVREFTDDYVRERIRELPAEQAIRACESITKLGRNLASLGVTIDIEEDIPLLGLRKGQMNLQRFFHWNLFKCFWNDEFDFFTNNIINFDWYHPEYCFRFAPDEFRAWFESGWEILAWDVQEAGISCRARRSC